MGDTLSDIVYQAVGGGSTCWEYPERAGEFQSDRASDIAARAVNWIERHYVRVEAVEVEVVPDVHWGDDRDL